MQADRCGNTRRQKCRAKGSGKKVKIQEFWASANVEPEMHDYTSNNWSYWILTRSLKKSVKAIPGKHSVDLLQKTASYTGDITYNMESTAVWNLKPERSGSPLVQEKCQEEKACDQKQQQ